MISLHRRKASLQGHDVCTVNRRRQITSTPRTHLHGCLPTPSRVSLRHIPELSLLRSSTTRTIRTDHSVARMALPTKNRTPTLAMMRFPISEPGW